MSKPTQQGITFSKNDVEIIARETLYRGFFSLDLYRFRHRLFNGGMSGEITREIFERGHAAVLLPFDPVRDEVVLVEQIRIAAYDTSESPWLLEMVAGMIEAGETVEDVARREALEEAGLEVGRTKPILSYLASPGGTSERLSIPVGEVDASTAKAFTAGRGKRGYSGACGESGAGLPVGRRGENRQRSLCHRLAMAAIALSQFTK